MTGHSALAGWLVSCLLRSRSRKRPAWCPSLTRSTRLWLSSPEVPSLRPLLDPSVSIGPLKVNSQASLRARRHLFLSIVGHVPGSPGETAHFLRERIAVATSLGRMCPMTWYLCLAGVPSHWTLTLLCLRVGEHLATWVWGFVWCWAPRFFLPSSSMVCPHCRI